MMWAHSRVDMPSLIEELKKANFGNILSCPNVNDAYNNLSETLQTAIKNCTSFKRTKKKHKPKKPWITPGIIRSVNRKQINVSSKKYMYTKKESDKLRYNAFRNKLNGIIHRSRKIYFENLLQKSRSNLKKDMVYCK